ncbi:M20 metallopeptidase family protein [Phytohabitans rumicis]|uniref:N-acyl-L-amino acid amidohydrolase n=1 Tax=Phytohabitans rumicis TaxID=1076125 RepID=A0A6V8LIW7_9ACTN|nr:M20 family metallopeptidase [Phytohabitans rumicis]GFJ94861.1 N-acyl-L-amino acid amidohydrolase [Phytohabitans rumicis]
MSVDARPDIEFAALHAALRAELPAARRLRRRIHADPRLAADEQSTLDLVLGQLPGPAQPVAQTGALVRMGRPGPAVAVRAELDALPLVEETGVAWASVNGAMHACGHDVHLAALVALTRAVAQVDGAVPLVAVFQPREETYPSGARDIVESDALDREGVAAVVGAHVQPVLAGGQIACTPGAVNAAADEFVVSMHGRAGHAAYPHLNRDAVLALAQCVVSLQQLISRDTDPMVPAVLTVGAIAGGEAANATPGVATARGIIRSMSEAHRRTLHERLHTVVAGVAQVHDCTATVEIISGEPVLHNDPGLAAATSVLLAAAGYEVVDSLRSCGADDFAYYAARYPSLMLFVGLGDGRGPALHHPAFLPDDGAVDRVAEVMLAGYLAATRIGVY